MSRKKYRPHTRHGQSYVNGKPTREYKTWTQMLQRCGNPKAPDFVRYGGRGVVVCERWQAFANFLADMEARPEGKTLDRFPDKDGNYEPGNCRWATAKQQQRNIRSNRLLSYLGETRPLTEWAELLNLNVYSLRARASRGWSAERMLTTPVKSWTKHV